MTSRIATAGWLARQLVQAEHNLHDVERQAEGYLSYLFPIDRGGWNGWAFHRADSGGVEIDVYQATETAAAVAALHRSGFAVVRIHPHPATKLISCACVAYEAP